MKCLISSCLIYFLFHLPYVMSGACEEAEQNCFSCSGTLINKEVNTSMFCEWSSGTCIEGSNVAPFDPIYAQYNQCYDADSEIIRNKYCGPSQYTSADKDLMISLWSVEGVYGKKSVMCKYVYINEDEDASVYVSIKLGSGVLYTINMLIEARFYDGTTSDKHIDNSNFLVMIEKCHEVDLYFVADKNFTDIPFTISVKSQKPGMSITLIITIVLIVAACLVCSVSIWIFSRKIARRNAMAQQNMGNVYVGGIRIHPGETEEMLKKRKMKQLATLMNSVLVGRLYDKELAQYNANCTICFEEYTKTSNVCLTECKHVFHYDCLKSWLTKNLLNPKCPNCNFILLPDPNTPENVVNEDATQSIPFVSGRSGNQRTNNPRSSNVVNNFVAEGTNGGARANTSSTRVIRQIHNNEELPN